MANVVICRAGGGDLAFNFMTVVLPVADDVWIDDVPVGNLSYHHSFKVALPLGHHKIRIRTASFEDPIKFHGSEIEVDLNEAKNYFFRVKTYPGFIQGHPHLVPMEQKFVDALLKQHPIDTIETRFLKK